MRIHAGISSSLRAAPRSTERKQHTSRTCPTAVSSRSTRETPMNRAPRMEAAPLPNRLS